MPTPLEAALARQTQLFLPANRPERAQKAASSGADAVVVDLEDAVAPSERSGAREILPQLIKELRRQQPRLHVVVRVNAGDLQPFDLQASIAAGVDGVLVPKVASPNDVATVEAQIDEIEGDLRIPAGRTQVQLLVESSGGVLHLPQIAAAGNRVVAVMLGTEDLATDLEIDPAHPDFDIRWAHGLLVASARANGLAPYGLLRTLAEFRDLDKLRRDAERSKAFGYVGTLCIHPAQIPVLNEAFRPTAEEVERARQVIAALAHARALGHGAAQLNGAMVDTPMVKRAERILLRAASDDRRARSSGARSIEQADAP